VRVAIQSTFNSQIAIRAKERKRNWFGFLFLERGQFGVALNKLADGLQEACVHLGRKESRLTIRARPLLEQPNEPRYEQDSANYPKYDFGFGTGTAMIRIGSAGPT
jgi:hypothetical protein